jgi:hypothetical protein
MTIRASADGTLRVAAVASVSGLQFAPWRNDLQDFGQATDVASRELALRPTLLPAVTASASLTPMHDRIRARARAAVDKAESLLKQARPAAPPRRQPTSREEAALLRARAATAKAESLLNPPAPVVVRPGDHKDDIQAMLTGLAPSQLRSLLARMAADYRVDLGKLEAAKDEVRKLKVDALHRESIHAAEARGLAQGLAVRAAA